MWLPVNNAAVLQKVVALCITWSWECTTINAFFRYCLCAACSLRALVSLWMSTLCRQNFYLQMGSLARCEGITVRRCGGERVVLSNAAPCFVRKGLMSVLIINQWN
jgi:hypothetical protein